MILSPAERAYLRDSLALKEPIRPDSRSPQQFRPLEASCSFLPNSYGSSRVRLADGSEVIISVKGKVVRKESTKSLISVGLDINGHRDDSNYVNNLVSTISSMLLSNFPSQNLKLSDKYSFKIFIDIVILSHTSHPLTLISLGIYLALKSTRLPLLTSTVSDREIEEQPTFDDDWEASKPLFGPTDVPPPLLFVVGFVAENVFVDPSLEEEEVCENGLIVTYRDGTIISPLQNFNLSNKSNTGFNIKHITDSRKLILSCASEVTKALDNIVDDESYSNIF